MEEMNFWNCVFFSLFLVFFLILSLKTRRKLKLPPGPKPLPLIGNFLDIGEIPYRSFAKLAEIHGPVMTLKLGHLTSIVISSVAMAKEILQTHDPSFSGRFIFDALRAHGHNDVGLPWMPVSPLWRKLRRICNTHLFTGKPVENLRRRKVEELVGTIRSAAAAGEAVDIRELAFMTMFNLLTNMIFSMDLGPERAKFVKNAVWDVLEEFGKPNMSDYFPVLKKIDPQGIRRRTKAHMGKVFDFVDDMIKERNDEIDGPDLLQYVLNNGEDEAVKLEKKEVQHLVKVLFMAGTDPTAATLQWAMAELLSNPEKLSKAQEEIRRVLGKSKAMEESDVSKLPYLQAVVKETFRLHPIGPFLLPRTAMEDVEVAGFIIPKNAQVLVNVWAIGRDPSNWENPEAFEPERFLGLDIDIRGRNFELLPFGGGLRMCPGLPLAMRMMHLMLGSLIQLFDWKVEDGGKVKMDEKFGVIGEMAHPLILIPSLV